MKQCPKCLVTKAPTEFVRDRRRPGGVGLWCRECHRVRQAGFRRANPDKVVAANARSRAKRDRWWRYMSKYGMTRAAYDKLLDAQGGGCAICGAPPRKMLLDVDHCHESGKVRGLLCRPCNTAIGRLGDTATMVSRAVRYLGGS